MENETSIAHASREQQRAREKWEKDVRFRALAEMAVVRAIRDHGPIDRERPERDSHRIALQACVLALSQAFDNDAELTEARSMVEKLRGMVLDVANLTPRPVLIIRQDS